LHRLAGQQGNAETQGAYQWHPSSKKAHGIPPMRSGGLGTRKRFYISFLSKKSNYFMAVLGISQFGNMAIWRFSSSPMAHGSSLIAHGS
jgi:hypothetical protein